MHFDFQLNKEQIAAVHTLNGPVLVIAGAGSGKTRVVTFRIVNLIKNDVSPSAILGLTFTNKAAEEMRERVRQLTHNQVLICTFHALGVRLLREIIQTLGYTQRFTIYDEQDSQRLIKLCLEEMGVSVQKQDFGIYLDFISGAKNALQSPLQVNIDSRDPFENKLQEIYALYQKKLLKYNAVDFDDLLYLPVSIFREYPDILAKYQARWSHLLIDEYQDTNEAQYTLIHLLAAQHKNLCVVGDPDQAIYSWRGANLKNILNFENDYPGAKVIRLEQNYRSRSNILEAANALIVNNSRPYAKNLWSDQGPGEKIQYFTGDTERNEAEFIADKIRMHHQHHQIPLNQMAVLYRTNAQSRALEDRMILRQIPYVIVGGVSFYQRREVKDILAFLRLIHSGSDFISFVRTINLPKRGLGEATIDKIHRAAEQENLSILNYCERLAHHSSLQNPVKLTEKQREALKSYIDILNDLHEINKGCSLSILVKTAIERTGYLEYLKEEKETYDDRKDNLISLVTKAMEWELSSNEPSLSSFLEELSLKSSLDESATSQDRVHLMTAHNGKGLEFTVVFLAGLEDDLFPHANSRESDAALEEERRLCYVGITRAKEYLYLCNVRQRFLWGTTRTQRPSRFLYELPAQNIEKVHSFPRASLSESTSFFHEPKIRHKNKESVPEEKFMDDVDQTIPDDIEFSPETVVFHHEFGLGVVRKAYQGSLGLMYKVLFSNDQRERTLVAKFVKLKRVS